MARNVINTIHALCDVGRSHRADTSDPVPKSGKNVKATNDATAISM